MVVINNIPVCMVYRFVTMRVTVRFRSFPTFVSVVMMDIVDVLVFVDFARVYMHQDFFVILRLYFGSQGCKYENAGTKDQCSDLHAGEGT